LAIPPLLIIW